MIKYSKNIINLLCGRILTNIGDSIFYMIILWYFNKRFQSPMLLSALFILTSTIDIFSFLLGPIIDKLESRFLLILASSIQIIISLLLGIRFFLFKELDYDFIGIELLICMFIIYIASSIIYPLESKMIPLITKKDELVNVNSLFQISYKVLDVLFDSIATLLVAFFNISFIFIIAGIFFLIATNFYRLIYFKKTSIKSEEKNSSYLLDLKVGIIYLKKQKELLALFIPLALLNFFYAISAVGMPRFSEKFISDSSIGYGAILLASSIGGINGTFLMQFLKIDIKKPQNFISFSLVMAGISKILVPFSVTNFFYGVFVFSFFTTFFISMMNVVFISLVQTTISQKVLGRVSTLIESIISIMIPVGSFFGGIILIKYKELVPQYSYGIFMILFGVYYYLSKNNINKFKSDNK